MIPLRSNPGPSAARRARPIVSKSDRKSTRLNSSHGYISYAVFCLKKKKKLREPLAKTLNSPIGASRAAADARYAPNEVQVGHTRQAVGPEPHIARGTRAAIPHHSG